MSRPRFEVADIIRSAGADFIERTRSWLRWTLRPYAPSSAAAPPHSAATSMSAPAAVHRATFSYNSCRNRHCPKCQTGARERGVNPKGIVKRA